jgi:hypothetical protein
MPGLVPGIHVLEYKQKDLDGRDEPNHDQTDMLVQRRYYPNPTMPLQNCIAPPVSTA